MSDQQLTDRDIALRVTTRALGDRSKALELLFSDPDAVGEDVIAAERSRMKAEADAQAKAEYAASPDGLRERAMRLQEARAKTKADALLAHELLLDQGHREEDLASLRPEEKIELAGLADAPAPDPNAYVAPERSEYEQEVDQFRRTFFQKAEYQRRDEAARLGLDLDQERAAQADRTNIFS